MQDNRFGDLSFKEAHDGCGEHLADKEDGKLPGPLPHHLVQRSVHVLFLRYKNSKLCFRNEDPVSGKAVNFMRALNYQHGRYHVSVAEDGGIKILPNDWLSKYSAAIHNDFWHVYEFGRKGPKGRMERIKRVDFIRAGETIYHLPTLLENVRPPLVRPEIEGPPPQMSEMEKRRLTVETLKHDFGLRAEHGHILEVAYEIVHGAEATVTLAEAAQLIHAAGLAGSLEILGAVLLPIISAISFWNALESSERLYGMQGVAYTITAWAWGRTPPSQSTTIINNLENNATLTGHGVPEHHTAWATASQEALANLAKDVIRRKTTKEAFKLTLRALGEDKPEILCARMIEGFDSRLHSVYEKLQWKLIYRPIRYPD